MQQDMAKMEWAVKGEYNDPKGRGVDRILSAGRRTDKLIMSGPSKPAKRKNKPTVKEERARIMKLRQKQRKDKKKACKICAGNGQIGEFDIIDRLVKSTCTDCDGTGIYKGQKHDKCKGKGCDMCQNTGYL